MQMPLGFNYIVLHYIILAGSSTGHRNTHAEAAVFRIAYLSGYVREAREAPEARLYGHTKS